ncbi:O-antigen polymerase [Aliarcobacter vitoriensis]|uniref:Oligosaccharide repeat unit polymerase n=1 Tax=Aliarcobacter vitoriensis TaxID=2011099 RepID=A0A366MT57_9BACT|nr:O-antigen polymerase [Aliarcobacter vitoriensis]RBQ29237.1 hypothetical protein CRU91_05250 [Aliarcobacter vitoriensis]
MIYLISLFVLVLSAILFKMSAGTLDFKRMNLVSIIFYKDFVLMTFFGVLLIATSFDIYSNEYFWGITGHVSEQSRYYGWLSTMYTFLVFPIGMILANFIFLRKFDIKKDIKKYFFSPTLPFISLKESSIFFVLVCALIVSTLAILYVFAMIGKIPILYLFSGADALFLGQLRGDAKIGFSGIVAIRDIIAINFTLLLSLILYAYKLYYKKGKFKLLFYYSFILVILALTYNLEKSPIFFYIFGLLIVRIIFYGYVSIGKLIFTALIMMIGVALFLSFFVGEDILKALLFRVLVGQSVAIFQGFEYFPNVHEFLGWSGISKLFASLSGEDLKISGRILFEIYNPRAVEIGTAGYIVGLFNAEAWMLFGFLGVLLAPLYVGFFVQILHIFLLKNKKTPIFIGLYAYFCIKLPLSGTIATFLYPTLIISVIVFVWLIIITAKILNQKYNWRKY